jgi:hypothetical protein
MANLDAGGYNPSSPAGQIESAGAFATGLSHLTGWRRHLARWLIVALLMAPAIATVVSQLAR